jgi:hypothetical protein
VDWFSGLPQVVIGGAHHERVIGVGLLRHNPIFVFEDFLGDGIGYGIGLLDERGDASGYCCP